MFGRVLTESERRFFLIICNVEVDKAFMIIETCKTDIVRIIVNRSK